MNLQKLLNHLHEDDLILLLRGTLENPALHRAIAHIHQCPSCFKSYEETREYLRDAAELRSALPTTPGQGQKSPTTPAGTAAAKRAVREYTSLNPTLQVTAFLSTAEHYRRRLSATESCLHAEVSSEVIPCEAKSLEAIARLLCAEDEAADTYAEAKRAVLDGIDRPLRFVITA